MALAMKNLVPLRFRSDVTIVPVVRLSGIIGGGTSLLRSGLSLHAIEGALTQAFASKSPMVALVINSPGGAAVQSHMIYRRIRALAEEKNKRVVAAVEDVAASGGYMIACAADEIIVDQSSIVGSIGVISAGFGFKGLIDRIGVERRVYTAGTSKSMLDPFQPVREEDVARLKMMQEDVHAGFIDLVKSRRPKLASDPDLFTGAFWSGRKGVAMGLADRIGELRTVMRERFGPEVRLRMIPTERPSWWRRRLGVAGAGGDPLALVDRAVGLIEERAMWGRFGL
jgi:serine protease SohB